MWYASFSPLGAIFDLITSGRDFVRYSGERLPRYDYKADFMSDLAAGAAVSATVIPHSLAMAILAGLPPVYGLYSSWVRLSHHQQTRKSRASTH